MSQTPAEKKEKRGTMKLPNGYGSVHKLPGRRRNPYRVRKFREYEFDEEKNKYIKKYDTIGYYKTRAEGLQALAEYNEEGYNIKWKDITFAEAFKLWLQDRQNKMGSMSNLRGIRSAYNYAHPLHDKKMVSIKTMHLKNCIENAYVITKNNEHKKASRNTQEKMKSLFNQIYRFCLANDIVRKNYAELFLISDLEPLDDNNKIERNPYTNEEIKKLFEIIKEEEIADMILIQIFSGWRPSELISLKISDIDWTNKTMKGGMKTEAGKDRIVPIHKSIEPLIKNRYDFAVQNNFTELFIPVSYKKEQIMTYDKYRHRVESLMKKLGWKHTPHDARHTFITKAKATNMNEYILKIIVGHSVRDVTEAVYTHRSIKELYNAINKIPIYSEAAIDN